MNALTKRVVMASTLLAAALQLYLAAPGFGPSVTAGLAGFVVAGVCGLWVRNLVVALVLFPLYLFPAALMHLLGADHFSLETLWMAPLLGLMVIDGGASRWHLPEPWRLPLVTGALVVSVSWPIVALREVDFHAFVLNLSASNTSIGISPWEVVMWLVYTTLGLNLGVLWLDALFRWYGEGNRQAAFTRAVLVPLALSATLACGVGVYQGFVDLKFLSGHLWPYMERAAGTLMDANTFGTLAALWAPALAILLRPVAGSLYPAMATAALALGATSVWVSGSRTALAAFAAGAAAVLIEEARGWWSPGRAVPLARRLAPVALGVAAAVAVVAVIARWSTTTTVLDRGVLGLVPFVGDLSVGETLWHLWDRYGYGSAAVGMITEHPWAGVGLGGYHTLVHDYSTLFSEKSLPPDNAQNWYRHIVAELGVLGSAPWLAWTAMFLWSLISRVREGADAPAARMLRGPLLGFGAVSLLGVPGQSAAVAITLWTFVFWYARAAGVPAASPSSREHRPLWIAALALVALQATVTYASARGDLLPRHRAMRFGWDYRYGITGIERSPDGTPGRRWTSGRSLSLVPVQGKVLKFVAWTGHPEANDHPVPVKVWADSKLVYEGELTRENAFYVDIPAAEGAKVMVIETWIARTFRPSDYGQSDRRVLGLAIQDWRWE